MDITEQQYELALRRMEELLPLVSDNTPSTDANTVELIEASEIVREYEQKHFPIGQS